MPKDPTRQQGPRVNVGFVGNITGGTVIAVGSTADADADDEVSIDLVLDGDAAPADRDSAEPLRWQATRLDR